jgi:hypothetical protein
MKSMRYIIDDPELTGPGKYTYRWIKKEEMTDWIKQGPLSIRVSNVVVAKHLRSVLNQDVDLNSSPRWVMNPGDEGLVIRKATPERESANGKIISVIDEEHWEYGIIKRLE